MVVAAGRCCSLKAAVNKWRRCYTHCASFRFPGQGGVGGASLLVESWEACLSIPGYFSSFGRV